MKLLLGAQGINSVISQMRKVGEYYAQASRLGYSEEDAKAVLDTEILASKASRTYTYAQAVDTALKVLIRKKYEND